MLFEVYQNAFLFSLDFDLLFHTTDYESYRNIMWDCSQGQSKDWHQSGFGAIFHLRDFNNGYPTFSFHKCSAVV